MRSFRLGLGVLLLVWVTGCNCEDCVPTLRVRLPDLPKASTQPVSIELRSDQGNGDTVITCDTTQAASDDPTWSCSTAQQAASTGNTFELRNANVQSDWRVHVRGPTGVIDEERKPVDMDPGEGWPTACSPCYAHEIWISSEDLSRVGITSE